MGTQLGMFEGHGETLAERLAKHQQPERIREEVNQPSAAPPKPGPDDPTEPEEEDEEQPDEQALVEELLAAFKAIRPLLRRMAIEGAVSQELVDEALGYMAAIERAVLQGD